MLFFPLFSLTLSLWRISKANIKYNNVEISNDFVGILMIAISASTAKCMELMRAHAKIK